jgi:hypothetical protein
MARSISSNQPRLRSKVERSTCEHCRAEVWWFRLPDGRLHPPMVPYGTVLVLDEDNAHTEATGHGVVRQMTGLLRHICDPDELDRTSAEQADAQAVTVECPVCLAEVGQRCLNMSKVMGRKGSENQDDHTKWPHADRVVLATAKEDR